MDIQVALQNRQTIETVSADPNAATKLFLLTGTAPAAFGVSARHNQENETFAFHVVPMFIPQG